MNTQRNTNQNYEENYVYNDDSSNLKIFIIIYCVLINGYSIIIILLIIKFKKWNKYIFPKSIFWCTHLNI